MRGAAALVVSLLVLVGSCQGSAVFTYRTNGIGQFEAHFINSSDMVLVVEADGNYEREIRVFAPNGNLLAASEDLSAFGPLPPMSFVLVDELGILMPYREGGGRYGVVPNRRDVSPISTRVLAWLEGAGGLQEDRLSLSASTNSIANLSCALARDGSVAIWQPDADSAFIASPPRTFDATSGAPPSIYCLQDQGRWYAVIVAVYEGQSRAYMFSPSDGWRQMSLPLSFDGFATILLNAEYVSMNVISGFEMPENPELNPVERRYLVGRITVREARLVVEQGQLEGWPNSISYILPTRDGLAASQVAPPRLSFVTWSGEEVLPFTPAREIRRDDEFHRSVLRDGTLLFSPSGERILWVNNQGELRLEATE